MNNIKICEYGCGKIANFQLKNKKWCCCARYNSCEAVRKKNSESLKKAHKNNISFGFSNEARERSLKTRKRKSLEYFLRNPNIVYNSEILKRYLLEYGVSYKCSCCGISNWLGKPITLEIDHIDGLRNHNNLENLRFLCPNCHSQTDTWRGRNINSGKTKVSDEELLKALKECKNIRQALLKVGLAPKGANYIKARELLFNYSSIK